MDFGIDLTKNLSLYSVPAAFGLTMLPHLYSVANAGFTVYDNANPRNTKDTLLRDTSVSKERKHQILRAEAASINGFETLGLFAASVLVGNWAQLEPAVLNRMSFGFLVTRAAYTLSYIFIRNRRLSWVRTAIWQVTAGYIVMFWIRAGNKINAHK